MREYTDEEDFAVEGFMEKAKQNLELNKDQAFVKLEGFELESVVAALETLDVTEYKAKIRALRKKVNNKHEAQKKAYEERNNAFKELETLKAAGDVSEDKQELVNKISKLEKDVEFSSDIIHKCLKAMEEAARSDWQDANEIKTFIDDKHSDLLDEVDAYDQHCKSEENVESNEEVDVESLI